MKKQTLKHADFFQIMDGWAPRSLAYHWDNIGLQVGRFHDSTSHILVTLDVTEEVVDEAIEKQANLIIAHHPLLFQPLKQINVDHPKGRVVQKLLKNDITVFAAHTNLDVAEGGVNDLLGEAVGLKNREPLEILDQEALFKIIVFVPDSHVQELRSALNEGGAGQIGNYSHCTFQSPGQGTFQPLEGSTPYIGEKNELAYVDEKKLETVVPKRNLSKVIDAIISAHPYEEPAYDIYPLENKGQSVGIGRFGSLDESVSMKEFIHTVKKNLDMPQVRVSGNIEKNVKRVAVLGGSGEKYVSHALRKKADVYITGDMTFHAAQDAEQMGLTVIDAGHYIEKIMKTATQNKLIQEIPAFQSKVYVSEVNTDPFVFV
ncbi:Nif3-like dinuclear metal center hexameric protein [Oceanobacillus sp. FSL W8-0428]|uniref:GTP cyclohydrolase 1 type 2 homolog n=1 Tax=Oceanobacillus sojae TaxID=582851 RepID=A0A511ZFY6_9BACI|nr:Nif3-like dinuclear metal center hexameric protein [Oceanobacillus sojae]GEN86354.1 GTP cyclohydrolase 1 type 2 [Oceanobacillus sojae]